MFTPRDLRFTRTHEWVRMEDDRLVVGISDFAQQQLSDITNIELPEMEHHHYATREEAGVIESIKTATDYHIPVSGEIVEVNTDLLISPELLNSDPYGEGLIFRMVADDLAELDELMNPDEYDHYLPEED